MIEGKKGLEASLLDLKVGKYALVGLARDWITVLKRMEEGAKLKAFVFFKGRSIIFKEQGQILLLRLAQDLEEFGKVEQMPRLEGKRMTVILSPKGKIK